jgi:hypothetical protein
LNPDNIRGASAQAQAGWLLSEYTIKTVGRLLNFPSNMHVEYRSLIFTTKPNAPITRISTNVKGDDYTALGRSDLKSKLLKAGEDYYLDVLCF